MKNMKKSKTEMNRMKAGQHIDIDVDHTAWRYYKDGRIKQRLLFANLSKLETGKRSIFLRLPVAPWDDKTDILIQLLRYSLERYKIKHVFVDRFFFTSDALQVFEKLHIKYLMPCPLVPRIRTILKNCSTPIVVKDFRLKNKRFNLIIPTKNNKNGRIAHRAYATNEEIEGKNVYSILHLISRSSAHWKISISYEMVKHTKMTL